MQPIVNGPGSCARMRCVWEAVGCSLDQLAACWVWDGTANPYRSYLATGFPGARVLRHFGNTRSPQLMSACVHTSNPPNEYPADSTEVPPTGTSSTRAAPHLGQL